MVSKRPTTIRTVLFWSAVLWPSGFALAAIPPDTGDGWRISAPEDQGLASAALESMAQRIRSDPVFAHAYALLVARHGTLVFEEYFNGRHRDQRSDVRSVTKSVTSMAVGIAREEGRLPRSLNAPLAGLVPSYAPALRGEKAGITLFDVLTMQSGLRWDDSALPWWQQVMEAPDLVAYTLGEPLVYEPGTHFNYSTGLSQVLAKAVIEATGQPLASYVQKRLFKPLGIVGAGWRVRPSGDHFGGLGLEITPRDMAKLGQLALQDGNWHGDRLVPAQWLRESTRDQTSEGVGYGYHWWGTSDGEIFLALGYGGQHIYVERALDLVVVLQVDYYLPAEQGVDFSSFRRLLDDLRGGLRAERAGTIEVASALPIEVDEASGELRLELERSGPADGSLELAFRTVARAARAGRDFTATQGSLVWSPRQTGVRALVVPLVDDEREEATEDFEVVLDRLAGIDRLEERRIRVTVRDDDAVPSLEPVQRVRFESGALVATEGQEARFSVRRDSVVGEIAVAWKASAIFGGDEGLDRMDGTLTFRDGEASAELVLAPRLDGLQEDPEIFRLQLIAPDASGSTRIAEGGGVATLAVLDAQEPSECDSDTALCLHRGRFRVRALWRVPSLSGEADSGVAHGAALSSESGWFWFFRPGNLELMVKLLDGGAVNQSYWVFYGVLSDVEVFLLVEDLAQGVAKLYRREPGNLCGAADLHAFAAPSRGVAPLEGRAQRAGNEQTLLLDRFALEVEWLDPKTGAYSPATSVALTGETALQWFFAPGNYEMATKMLDGRAFNGHYWLFSSALTNLDYRLTVTDTVTGAVRVYDSAAAFCGLADVEAFAKE